MADKQPLNIQLVDNSRRKLGTLLPVTSLDIHDSNGDYHPHGLYSSIIFGRPGDKARQTQMGYIDMKVWIFHPKLFTELRRIRDLYGNILMGRSYATWNPKTRDFDPSDIIDGSTGYAFFMEHYAELDLKRNESLGRDLRIDLLERYRSNGLYRYVWVLPAGLRDIETGDDGRTVENEINPFYRKIIRISNTITASTGEVETAAMDGVRASLQRALNEVYQYIESILVGKKGFLLNNWGSRGIMQGTRNVITSMDAAPLDLDDPQGITVNDTIVGLFQFMKGAPDLTIHGIRQGPIRDVLSNLPNSVELFNRKTMKLELVSLSDRTLRKWHTLEGLEELIDGYEKLSVRHKPVLMDDHYVALTYDDGNHWAIVRDVSELPEGYDPADVSPTTWTELFYASVYDRVKDTGAQVTRYPINGPGSVYVSKLVLRTTVRSNAMRPLNDNAIAPYWPTKPLPFVEATSVHPSKVSPLNADFDGDMVTVNILTYKESVAEIDAYLNSTANYLAPTGGLNYGISNHISTLVLHNLTRGIPE